MSQQTLDLLIAGAKANFDKKIREGTLLYIPRDSEVIVTGDLHGNRKSFEKITKFADLKNNPNRHLILQEIIHGGPVDDNGNCLSFQLLIIAIKLLLEFPEQVHLIMGNHDTAFISHSEVMKEGREMNQAMRNAMRNCFGEDADKIDLEMARFLFSQPLAAKCPNRIWISHSLPDDRSLNKFDKSILHRQLKVNDIVRPNSAYLLTWGRRQSEQTVEQISKDLDSEFFILGHQPQSQGYGTIGNKVIILASEHSHGVLLKLSTACKYDFQSLINAITPLAAIE